MNELTRLAFKSTQTAIEVAMDGPKCAHALDALDALSAAYEAEVREREAAFRAATVDDREIGFAIIDDETRGEVVADCDLFYRVKKA